MRARKIAYACMGAAIAVIMSSPASATVVYSGNDYSYTTNSNTRPTICDREADARTAYVKGVSIAGNSFRMEDRDGSSGSCWYTQLNSGVSWHNTCEDVNNWPDACGNRSYH